MSFQPYSLRKPWQRDEDDGVVIVDTCTGRALPIGVHRLTDIDDADRFCEWAALTPESAHDWDLVHALLALWDYLRAADDCPECGGYTRLGLHRRLDGQWEVDCRCNDGAPVGVGGTEAEAVQSWNDAALRFDEGEP